MVLYCIVLYTDKLFKTTYLITYYIVFGWFWLWYVLQMAINFNVSVQYNGGLLADIILLTQCYYHRGARLNAMKGFCYWSL